MSTATDQPNIDAPSEPRKGPGRPPKAKAPEPVATPAPVVGKAVAGKPVKAPPVHVLPLPKIAGVEVEGSPALVHRIMLLANSTGARGSIADFSCHEFILAKKKIEALKENLVIDLFWDANDKQGRGRLMTRAGFADEVERLREKYKFESEEGKEFDLFQDVYGNARTLLDVMRKIEVRYRQIALENRPLTLEDLHQLCDLANPESALDLPEENELE